MLYAIFLYVKKSIDDEIFSIILSKLPSCWSFMKLAAFLVDKNVCTRLIPMSTIYP